MSGWQPSGRPPLPPHWRRIRQDVLAAGDTCYLCGQAGSTEVDHIIPRSLGGGDDRANLAPVCTSCHGRKSAAEGGRAAAAQAARLASQRKRPRRQHPGAM